MSLINEIILDHENFLNIKVYQASLLLDTNSISWLKIRSNLAPKYKFTIDLDTFSETLGVGVLVLPSRSAIWQKSSSVIELFVRYDFEHEQDAAVREMLIQGLTERNRITFNPSLTISYVSHRFASLVPPNLLGIIRIHADNMTKEDVRTFITKWDYINKNVYQQKLSYDSYHTLLQGIK